jgi:putative flippase GtrA
MGQGRYELDVIRRIAGQPGKKVRFLLAGLFNTILGLITYPALYFLTAPLKLHYLTILIISQVICVSIAFLTNKFLVFQSSGNVLLEFDIAVKGNEYVATLAGATH